MDKKRDRGALLFISILLHSLLALLPWQEPWQEKSRPVAVPQPPASPISVVDASQLPTLTASESQPLPAVPSSPPASAITVSPPANIPVDTSADVTPDEPVTDTSNRLSDESVPEAGPYAVPTTIPSALPTTTAPTTPSATPSVTPADEAKIAADWENLAGHLQRQNDGFEAFNLLDIFNVFGEPGQANHFFDENNQSKLDVLSYYLFPEQTPEQVLQTVVIPELTSNTGFDLQPQENFPAGLAYQLLQGEMLRYLIIVRLNERSGSVLMLSDSLPFEQAE